MIDLWQLLVVSTFQGFWSSVVALALLFFVMFWYSKISPATSGYFVALFFFAMGIGYGYLWISALIWIVLMVISLGAGTKIVNSMGIGG